MAPDAAGPSATPVSVAVGKLESAKAAGSPTSRPNLLSSKSNRNGFQSDRESDSSLSDLGEADSEAETERLHVSPQKPRPKIILKHPDTSGAAIKMAVDTQRATSHLQELPTDRHLDAPSPSPRSPNKKRKRDTVDQSNSYIVAIEPNEPSATPPSKRKINTQLPNGENLPTETAGRDGKTTLNGVSSASKPTARTNGTDDTRTPLEPVDPKVENAGSPHADQEETSNYLQTAEPQTVHSLKAAAVEIAGDPAREDDDEAAERDLKKKSAMEELAEIEKLFAQLKDSIYNERLKRVELEMQLLDEGVHPEYLAQMVCVNNRLKEKQALADAQNKYAMESLALNTRVTRAQIHSQYFQGTRDIREDALYKCSEMLFHIQRERRAGDTLVPEYTFRIPDRQSTRINQRRQYNWEVGILAGVAKHHGFPAAPDVSAATKEEIMDDLEAIGIQPPARQTTLAPNAMRLDSQYKRPSPAWPPSQQSPPSPPLQAVPPHSHAHVHRHHHHHHRPHVAGPTSHIGGTSGRPDIYLARRTISSLGPQPPQVPLSTLIQGSEGAIKMEPQPSIQSLSALKNNDSYPTPIQGPLFQQQTPRPSQYYGSSHHFGRQNMEQPTRMRSPTPGERIYSRDNDLDGLRRLKEEGETAAITGPLAGLPRFSAAAGRMGYS